MPGPNDRRVNPATGKRYSWEAEQEAKKAAAAQSDPKAIDQQIALLERLAQAKKAQEDLLTFTQFTMPDPEAPNDVTKSRYKAAKVHREVAKALTAFIHDELKNPDGSVCNQLIFCMPPRHGKTQLSTKSLSAWVSGNHPDWDIGVASYSDTMAEDMGADTRAILTSKSFKQVFPRHALRRGGTSKSNIQTEKGGRLVFVGRGGALTGRGMALGIGDDLFKDHEEARSQTIRDAAWNWFTKVFMTRRMGKKKVILTMTLWHSDDVIGRITDPENPHYNAIEAAKWKIIRLPAIAEENDPLGRKPGEPLWAENYDLDFLQSQQRLDPLGFAALYQQRPTVADGVLFRRENIQRYDPKDLPENLRYYAASDHAVGTKQRNDPSCFGKGGIDPQGNLWLTELFWERVPTDRAVEQMLSMGSGTNAPLIWWAESGHISKSIGPFLFKRMTETERFIQVREIVPSVDKETRAQSIAARVAVGKVYLPKGPIWDKAVEEMLAFPNGTHDDFVDMLSLFGIGLQSQFGATAPAPKQSEPKFGTAAWLKWNERWAKAKDQTRAVGQF